MKKIFFTLLIFISFQSLAEEFPGAQATSSDEFEKGFAENKGMQSSDHDKINQDRLKIGGSLQAEMLGSSLENKTVNDYISDPLTLELYLDSQLKDDVRAFFRGRFIHDPSVDESVANSLTGLSQKQNTSSLDEVNLRFQTNHKIFWTVGRQKIKWGTSRFWNPTDFLNQARRDFLYQEDLRAGVSLVKAHVPWGTSNFYFITSHDKANDSTQIGGAARAEIPFSFGEWSASIYGRKGQSTKVGSDLSFSVWDLDFYLEGAGSDYSKERSASGGFIYEFKYNDEDTASINLETFWQENGVDDKSTYGSLLSSGRWIPFYIAKNYSSASFYLTKPGAWNNSTFVFYFIQNMNDRSLYYRGSWVYTGLSDATWTLSLGSRAGDSGTEMRYLGQKLDGQVMVKIKF